MPSRHRLAGSPLRLILTSPNPSLTPQPLDPPRQKKGSSLLITHLMRMRRLRFRSCRPTFRNAWWAGSFPSLPSHKTSLRQQRKKNRIGYFGVFRGRPRGHKVDTISDADTIWACDSGKATAREARHARAIGHSLPTNPYCS